MSLLIRRAGVSDAEAIAAILLAARRAAMPWLAVLHTDAETRWWVRTVMLSTSTVWVAEEAAQPIGFVALCRDVVEHLYVHPECWGRRVGTQLIDTVRAEPLDKIALYGFQRNARARRFYEARGFKLKAFGNGVTNEAGEPDAYYEWHRRGSALAVF